MKVLILGGTGEGRALASQLRTQGVRVVSSLAGRVSSPRLPEGEVRIGGFGGADGLAEFLVREQISAVVDATHPFAARISANAALACSGRAATAPDSTSGSACRVCPGGWAGRSSSQAPATPLLILRRPPWHPQPGDRWTFVRDIPSAAAALGSVPPTATVLLTTGRQETAAFAPLPHHFVLRAVETPDGPLPQSCEVVLDRGPFTLEGERKLFADQNVLTLVTKNSGGPMTAAKLTAARELGLEVVMVERPPLPAGVPVVPEAAEAVAWVSGLKS